MARDPLGVLRQIRKRSVDAAQLRLGLCARLEREIESGIRSLDEEAAEELRAPGTAPERLHLLEIFANRARQREAQRDALATELAAAAVRTDEARRELASSRIAEEVVDALIEERAGLAAASAERRAQHELDDISRGMRAKSR